MVINTSFVKNWRMYIQFCAVLYIEIAVFRVPNAFSTDSDVSFEDQKRLLIKMFTSYNRLNEKSRPNIFHTFIDCEFGICRVFIVPNLNCIYAVFTMLWPFQQMLIPCYSTVSSVDKFFGEYTRHMGKRILAQRYICIYIYLAQRYIYICVCVCVYIYECVCV